MIAIISANYQREDILELFCMGIQRLRNETMSDILAVMVGDDNDVCNRYDVIHVKQKNEPVSEKFNTALRVAVEHKEVTHIMVIGSDDIIPTQTFLEYDNKKDFYDYLGVRTYYFLGAEKGFYNKAWKIRSSVIGGAGRMFSVDLLMQAKSPLNLWHQPMNKSLDNLMYSKLAPHIKHPIEIEGCIIDVKSDVNINRISYWADKLKGREVDCNEVLSLMSKQESDYYNFLHS